MFPRFFSFGSIPAANQPNILQVANFLPGTTGTMSSAQFDNCDTLTGDVHGQLASIPFAQSPINASPNPLGISTTPTVFHPMAAQLPLLAAQNAASVLAFAMTPFLGLDRCNQASLFGLLPLMTSSGVVGTPGSLIDTENTSSSVASNVMQDAEAHTIVRAPVLYKTAAQQRDEAAKSQAIGSSPPDRIVASYAVAARAAAIAGQRPLSSAAEVFLSASSDSLQVGNSRGFRARNKLRAPTVVTEFSKSSTTNASGVIATSSKNAKEASNSLDSALPWNSTWARIVDRQANVVVYISPDGSRLKSLTELRDYLDKVKPDSATIISDASLNANFCFDSAKDIRLISAPDDSLFAWITEPTPTFQSASNRSTSLIVSTASIHADKKCSSHDSHNRLTPLSTPTAIAASLESRKRLVSADADESCPASVCDDSYKRLKLAVKPVDGTGTLHDPVQTADVSAGKNGDGAISGVTFSSTGCDESPAGRSTSDPGMDSLSVETVLPSTETELTPSINPAVVGSTTSTFVTRSLTGDSGPSVVTSVLPPTSFNQSSVAVVSGATDLFAGNILCSNPNSLFAQLQRQQQQIDTASPLTNLFQLQLQQQQRASFLSSRAVWPFMSASQTMEAAGVARQVGEAALLQYSSAVGEYQRQQQAALLIYQQHLQQHQQLQNFQALLQQAAKFNFDLGNASS